MVTDRVTDFSGNIAVWAITPAGIALGKILCQELDRTVLFIPEKEPPLPGFPNQLEVRTFPVLNQAIQEHFNIFSGHIFIFATGIAVRMIAPLLVSKLEDPCVVVMDEKGIHAISLVSGHLGGGNTLARKVGLALGSRPVITTATDVNDLAAIDQIAVDQGLHIETPALIKRINMKILKKEPLALFDPFGRVGPFLSPGLASSAASPPAWDLICTHEALSVSRETMILRPKVLSLGIGCNRGTALAEILDLVYLGFQSARLSINAAVSVSTIDAKADEAGILSLASYLDCPLNFYDKERLNRVETVVNPSEMAKKHLGVRSVCEAAAILGARGGPLILPKLKSKNATLAVALMA